jgi:ABC-type phosphate transport system auxiliary subunit
MQGPGFARRTTRLGRLLDRVTRRRHAVAGKAESAPATMDTDERLATLERRVAELEALLEGLQDSVHREAVRREGDIEELRRKTLPGEIARALGEHGRKHGL